jgi:hypothetical protein
MKDQNEGTAATGEVAFNPVRADGIRTQALAAFESKQRKILRISGTYLVVLLAIAWGCLRMFNRATDVQSWVFYGIIFLVMVESTVLMKLWFWVLHSKLDVQRELRTLRMDLAIQKSSEAAVQEAASAAGGTLKFWKGWEPKVWRYALLLMGLLLGLEIMMHGPASGGWTSFRKEILSVGDSITSGPREFQFEPKGKVLFLDIRADTSDGTVKFSVFGPDGKELGWHSGGGMTVSGWRVNAENRGTYTLRVTPQDATGTWRARIQEVERNPFHRYP